MIVAVLVATSFVALFAATGSASAACGQNDYVSRTSYGSYTWAYARVSYDYKNCLSSYQYEGVGYGHSWSDAYDIAYGNSGCSPCATQPWAWTETYVLVETCSGWGWFRTCSSNVQLDAQAYVQISS